MGDLVRLVPEDLIGLGEQQPRPSVIKRLRDHHHLVARMVAEGRRTGEIARETGLCLSRVSILKSDPAFQQLVEMYRINLNQLQELAFYDCERKRALLKANAYDHLNERYEDEPENITPAEALAHLEFAEGKVSKNLNLNVELEPLADRHERHRRHIEAQAEKNAKEIAEGK